MADGIHADLVLVGGGHAHVQVIRRWMMRPLPGVRLSVVLDRPEAVYSGMVPGFVAGEYEAPELEIDVWPLARRAGARVVPAAALRMEPEARRIRVEGRPDLPYDVASLDVGSGVRGLSLPGVTEFALATRPIRAFVDRLDARLAALAERAAPRVAVVGGGAAGVELAFTLEARLRAAGAPARLAVLTDDATPLPGASPRLRAAVLREAARRGVELRCGARVERVEKEAVVLAGGEPWPCDLAVWATGAAAPDWLAASPLPTDPAGFVRVRPTLQVVGHDALFAVGDCAALEDDPWVPKAGVYAVRQGPVLDRNLRARLTRRPLRPYRPQRDFLTLLNLGGRRALGGKWGLAASGRGVWHLKDRIDRRFVRRFQVLTPEGAPSPRFPRPDAMDGAPMECGGCAAKLDAGSLGRALARLPAAAEDPSVQVGLGAADDAAVLRGPGGELRIATVDGFRAFADDPWLVGRVAAVNAVNDVLAVGGRPRHALAWVTVADLRPAAAEETLRQVLAGVRAALDALGVSLVGGHTTTGDALSVGLAVDGVLEQGEAPLLLGGARPGDRLVLTRPLGSGVLLAADRQGRLPGRQALALWASLVRPSQAAARVARAAGVCALTDVSGFGLAGHLDGLLRASGVSARLDAEALPAFDGALALLARGVCSTFHAQNAAAVAAALAAPAPASGPAALLFDPQTAGGLLLALPAERTAGALAALRAAGEGHAAVIGTVEPARADGARIVLAPPAPGVPLAAGPASGR